MQCVTRPDMTLDHRLRHRHCHHTRMKKNRPTWIFKPELIILQDHFIKHYHVNQWYQR